jgi:HSP20 family protein
LIESQQKEVVMLARFEPYRPLDPITEQLLSERRAWQIPVDAYRRGNEYKVLLDLPGTDPGSIELTVEKDLLAVRAKRTWIQAEDDQIQIAERGQGDFSRQLFLGEGLDREKITACYENGVLTVTIPVIEQVKPRKVEIAYARDVPQVVEPVLADA